MKTHFVIILLILVGVLSYIIGYSMAPTDVSVVRHSVQDTAAASSGAQAESGGYGSAPASGGYGAAPAAGGYGAPAAGGYGAPATGGYGAH